MQYIGNVSYVLAALQVPYNFLYRNNQNIINDTKVDINFQSALNLQVGSIATYHENFAADPQAVIYSKDFMYLLENNYRVNGAIDPITKMITQHMLEYTDEISKVALEISAIFACISLIIFPIVVVLLRIQSAEYSQIVHSLHKILTIVIIQHISELTLKNSEKDKTEKFESALHIQDSHGIPSLLLGILNVICIIAFIIISFLNLYVLSNSKKKFQVLPYQLMNGATMASNIYDQMAVAKRIWAYNARKRLNADGSFLATKVWPKTTGKILTNVDNALFGKIDNISYGFLLTDSASRSLFFETVSEATTNTLHHMFLKFGFIFSMEADVSEMRYFSEFTRNKNVFNKDNERLLNMIHYNDIHLTSSVLDKLLNNTFTDIDTDLSEQKFFAILTPIIGFIVLAILISIFIYYQMQILRTFRFTILSLSMLDQKFIQSNERLLDIAAGNFSSDSQSNSIPTHYIDCLKESTVDAVLITNKNFDILESNHAAKTLSSAAANAKNIEDIIGLPEEIKKVANSSTPTSVSFKKTLKSDSGQSYEMDISSTLCSNDHVMIIMHRDLIGEQLAEDRRKTEKKLKDILNRIVPHDFREMFGESPFKTVSFDNVLLFAVRPTNITFSAEESDESFQVVLQRMKKFNEIVISASKNSDDCAIVKKHNMAMILCYNLKTQKRTMQQPLAQAIEAIKEIRNECDKQDIKIAAVAVFSRQSVIGIASLNKANFNIFAPEIPLLLKGLSTAGDDELLLSKVDRDIPQNMRDKVRQSEDFLVINIHDC
ncbi:hypothetical protein TVAG_020310 [Trichomonas vaginalis G3]|uniref:PAS domain-containing protein n=1 Tax=Trichomonas vaginalis (strain ATCC PRA-98 / G3) TaxID=412133 RepID=A2EQ20_TRIV3|nr:hypothetical protein TVAGG3_0338950 [Trichomonas vaginalis G3]EAY05285.1 hypothetical protein TVAG_020310 [Trichomonas vaginalis G3]KAI5530492.1 hypothetical protein TVAGG3_0338950 [Trichomonas vaginalis G3]|eukprot:XP_001317508.1 hypothetical protein [Trichomonas vaginalis G3]